jgi:hypothetical protein
MNLVIDSTLRTVGELYLDACQELCATYGVPLMLEDGVPRDVVPGKGCYESLLTLNGQDLRLTSVLTVEASLLVATHAAGSPQGGRVDLEDWCREFSNQLGGRLKNKLLPLGVEVKMGLAALIPYGSEALEDVPPTEVQRCCFSSPRGWLQAELSMHATPGFAPAAGPGAVQGDALLEGMYLMF